MPAEPTQWRPRSPTRGFRVLILDDHELFGATLAMALIRHGLDARWTAVHNIDDVLSLARRTGPGLAVLDLHLGFDDQGNPMHGSDLVGSLRSAGWTVLVVSGSAGQAGVAAAIAAGAVGSVPKSASFEALLDAVVRVPAGEPVMSEAERQEWMVLHCDHQAEQRELVKRLERLERLSAREREVLDLLADGQRAAAIADRFVVSMATVRTQIRSVLTKLDVTSQLEAVAMVRRQPPVDPRA
ncbi:response regulator transcription factor [Pseudonocardia sp. H11422]|uniref:response regulator transcription factor n=1 Tax=Pseudonocardia sp. H11422 TaxID=2835866 RepID=UPI001BDBCDBE|nr:response regulator transcription factor [Pseudonocardia sp. H11422]